ncbi:MAG: H4MPT-linked C1 transfer pathway protein [Methanomicrobia archaeon]|nr:H4MPT-linked C1 transfer pathway protein [Methanomicrobia archaeon]
MFLGIDVGGANTKVATSEGVVESLYAPIWHRKVCLYEVLPEVQQRFGAELEAIGAVMTGELSDCFATRREGVLFIADAVATTFEDPRFFDHDGQFRARSAVETDPLAFAATNWLASAMFVAQEYRDAIFVDIGSTTTDVIPIIDGVVRAQHTDLERLKRGELIYSGVLRTNVAAVLQHVNLNEDEACRVSSELFAITADAYLVLGEITEKEYRCTSPNWYAFVGRELDEKSQTSALQRLARVVCSDLEELGETGTVAIAAQVKQKQVAELVTSLEQMKTTYGLSRVVAAGIGDFLIHAATDAVNLQFVSLAARYGTDVAATFPAFALAKLLEAEVTGGER